MRTSPVIDAPNSTPDLDLELDRYVESFEAAARDRAVDPADYLPPVGHAKYHVVLRELIRADLEFAWDRGDPRRIETYRDRFPSLFRDPDGVRDIATEEIRLRRAAGEEPHPIEYRERFGLDLFDLFPGEPPRATPAPDPLPAWPLDRVPRIGDTIPPGFVLEGELGSGSFGRVFLARQRDLAGRPVAVKVSEKLVGESQTLARLQHTNIVPLYSAHRVGRFTALVMPYLGRTTLADLIRTFRESAERPASGKAVFSTLLDRAAGTVASPAPSYGGAAEAAGDAGSTAIPVSLMERLNRFTFVEAVLWIGAELADGLAHAHERGVLHRDIKPANVLIADDGRPMLLDFNLAADANGGGAGEGIGGTIRYMAPEQIAALRADRSEHSVQSDVYALGLVLTELLTGRAVFDDPAGASAEALSRMRADRGRPPVPSMFPPTTPPSVVSILSKCLSPDRKDRYATAADLRDDLLRHLAHRPLKFAPNTSFRERLHKWARRHPRLSSSVTLGLLSAGVLAGVVVGFTARQWRLGQLEAERARDDLHATLGLVYAADGPASETRDLISAVVMALAPYRADADGWTDGPLLLRLSAADRAAVRQDAAVMMSLTSQLIERLARGEADPARRTALRTESRDWLARAERAAARADGETALAALSGGRLVEKAVALRALARDGDPRFATWMTLGSVEARIDRPAAAAEAFTAALGLNPRSPWPYFHRGLARFEAKQFAGARADFDRYLELRPDDPDGHFNRGLARFELRDPRGAIADYDAAERLGLKPNKLYVRRARAEQAVGDRDAAARDLRAAAAVVPDDPRAWTVRGELKLGAGDARGALADFDAALALDPDFLPALRNRVSVLSEQLNRPADAVVTLGRVLELAPHSASDRAGRAVLLARLGRKGDAREDAAVCANSDEALILYQAACGFLIAAAGPDDTARGLALLRKALRKDPTWAKVMPNDPDLKSVHGDPAFRELVNAAGVLAREK